MNWKLMLGLLAAGCGGAGSLDAPFSQAPNSSASPAPSANRTSQFVAAKEGATLHLGNGAQLILPPGALERDQVIEFGYRAEDKVSNGPAELHDDGQDPNADGDILYEVHPSQKLLKPATLKIPYPLDPQWRFPLMMSFSPENPLLASGGQETRYEPEEPGYDTEGDMITLQTDHFSGFQLFQTGEPAYLVMDVPAEKLQPADILVTLTTFEINWLSAVGAQNLASRGTNWVPGHVAVFVGASRLPGRVVRHGGKDYPGAADAVEGVSPVISVGSLEWFRPGFDNDHIYMGPRRPRDPLSSQQQNYVADQSLRALGKPYYLLGDGGALYSGLKGRGFTADQLIQRLVDPFATDSGYSCVGLVDVLYLLVDRPLASGFDRFVGGVSPKDVMENTVPVREVTLQQNQPFSMDFYGVIRQPLRELVLARVPYTRQRSISNGGVTNSYDLEFPNLPSGAVVSDDPQGYHFSWTPTQAGTFTMTVRMRAEVKERRVLPLNLIPFANLPSEILERGRNRPLEQQFTFRVQ